MKYAIISLGYFKQGDDLSHFLDFTKNDSTAAFRAHAESLMSVAEHLRKIADVISDSIIEIDANTHHIGISGPDEVIDKLIEMELAERDIMEDEEEDYLNDDDDDDDEGLS